MKTNKTLMKSLAWALLAGASALLLAASLPLLLSHFQAQAQPVAEITADDLVVDKKVNTDLAAPGDTVTYTIIIEKTGAEITAWMTDTLPGEVTYVTDSLQLFGPGSVGFADGVITWTRAAFGWSQEAVITFSAEISSGIIYTNVVNTAQVTGTGELVEDSATTLVGAIGNLDNADTYKSVSSNEAEPGDVLTYTIQVFNNSYTATVNGAWLTDTLHPALTFLTGSLSAGLGDAGFANGVITWTHDVGIRQSVELRFSAQISPDLPYNGWITNTVEIVAPLQSFTRSVSTNVYRGYPHLEASKSVYPNWVHPGECLTYTVHIVNTGDGPVETAWMTDTLPSEVDYASGLNATTGSYGVASDVITWAGSLAPSEEATIIFAVETLPDLENNTCFTNTAEITGAGSLVTASIEAEAITTFTLIFPIIFYNYPPAPVLNPIPTPVDHSYTVSWQPVGVSVDHYVLQQARDSKFSSPEQVWTPTLTLSQVVQDVYCAHYYRVRADKASDWGQGPWSNVESGMSSAPAPPVLSDIPDPDGNNSYTVSWSPITVDEGVVYVLQESTDDGFSSITQEWQPTTASQLVEKGSSYGTFYYRVRADDDDCWGQGSWSVAKSVEVQMNYYDSFNNSTSGWITHDASCCLSGCDNAREHLNYKYSLHYVGGRYRVDVPLDCRAAGEHGDTRHIYPVSFAPGIERPTSSTCLGLRGSFEEWDPYWSFWGLVFAASNDKSTVYSLEVNNLGDWAVVKRTGYQYPGPNHPWKNETRTHIVPYTGGQRWPAKSGFTPNTLKVSISGKKVKLYINDEEVYTFSDPDIQSLRRIGIIGGNWEITPTRIGYDYFFMDEGCDTY